MPEARVTPRLPSAERLMDEMQFLLELCQVVAAKSDLQPILDWIVNKTAVMLAADEGSIKLLDVNDPSGEPPVAKTLVSRKQAGTESGSWPTPVSISVMGYLMQHGGALASADLLADERFPGIRGFKSRIRSVLAVPLSVDGRVTGMLAVTTIEPGRQWAPHEEQLLTIVATNSAGVIEQARLRIEEVKKKKLEEDQERQIRELRTAQEIQMNFVPSKPLVNSGWEVRGTVVPAQQVGGDAFDYFELHDGRIAVAIADVSGKGVPAALLMSGLQASLRAFCTGRKPIPEELRSVNWSVARHATLGKFITLFYTEFDPGSGRLEYCNAGHNPPLLRRRDGTVEALEVGGMPLGIFENVEQQVGRTKLEKGDALLLYSDGIPEALDPREAQFGPERLMKLWRDAASQSLPAFTTNLLAEVVRFRAGAPQSDDITVVTLGPQSAE
jgi:serine phosphatase RsbU (regulator of sigma subunit)